MKKGIFTAMEVGGTYNLQECFDLVQAHEETGTPFFFLENCCYGQREIEKYSTVQNNVLYTLKNNPFGDDGNYGKDISTEGFEPLPVSEIGRTYY